MAKEKDWTDGDWHSSDRLVIGGCFGLCLRGLAWISVKTVKRRILHEQTLRRSEGARIGETMNWSALLLLALVLVAALPPTHAANNQPLQLYLPASNWCKAQGGNAPGPSVDGTYMLVPEPRIGSQASSINDVYLVSESSTCTKRSVPAVQFTFTGRWNGTYTAPRTDDQGAVFLTDDTTNFLTHEWGWVVYYSEVRVRGYVQDGSGGQVTTFTTCDTGVLADNAAHTWQASVRNTGEFDFLIDGVEKCSIRNTSLSKDYTTLFWTAWATAHNLDSASWDPKNGVNILITNFQVLLPGPIIEFNSGPLPFLVVVAPLLAIGALANIRKAVKTDKMQAVFRTLS